jgi:cellulose biosynthesis protein BcsQ
VKTIALIAQKGGVGKTTLAVNLAVASGLRTAIFDMDQQESAAIWADRRKSDMPHVEFITERRLAEALKAAEHGGFELSIAKLHVGGYYYPDEPVIIAFQKLGIDLRRTQQNMLLEAIADFVAKHEASRAFQ